MALPLGEDSSSRQNSASEEAANQPPDSSAPNDASSNNLSSSENVFAAASSEDSSKEKPSVSGTEEDPFRDFDQQGSFGEPPSAEDQENVSQETFGDSSSTKEESGKESSDQDSQDFSEESSKEEPLAPTKELFEFLSTYRFTREDLGFTPEEVYRNKFEEDDEPDALEQDVLDAMIFQGAYTQDFSIGDKVTFTLSTHRPMATRNALSILREKETDDQSGMDTMFNTMMVARNLVQIRGKETCKADPGDQKFKSRESIKKRFEFCNDLPQPILDAIGSRVNMFLQRIGKATMRDLTNF